MRVSSSVKLRCGKCRYVTRSNKLNHKKLFVICPTGKHKQRQG